MKKISITLEMSKDGASVLAVNTATGRLYGVDNSTSFLASLRQPTSAPQAQQVPPTPQVARNVLANCARCGKGIYSPAVIAYCLKDPRYGGKAHCMGACQSNAGAVVVSATKACSWKDCASPLSAVEFDFSIRTYGAAYCRTHQAEKKGQLLASAQKCIGCGRLMSAPEVHYCASNPRRTGGNQCKPCQEKWRSAQLAKPAAISPGKGEEHKCSVCAKAVTGKLANGIDVSRLICEACVSHMEVF